MLIPKLLEIDKELNVTTEYSIKKFDATIPIYKVHFVRATKEWELESYYVKLPVEKKFYTFEELKNHELTISQQIDNFDDQIKRKINNSIVH